MDLEAIKQRHELMGGLLTFEALDELVSESVVELEQLTADNTRQHGDLVRTMQALVETEQEVEKLKAEITDLKLEAIAAESIQYHPGESGLIREAKLRDVLENLLDHYRDHLANAAYPADFPEAGKMIFEELEEVKQAREALKGGG